MRKGLSYLRWVAFTLGIVILIGVIGIGVVTRTDRFRGWLREQLVSTLNSSFRGEVKLERLEGSIWGNLILHNLTLHYQGADILQVPRLTVRYALLPLLQGRVQVVRVEGVAPVLRLQQDVAGNWNLLEALSSAAEEAVEDAAAGSTLIVLLDAVVLQGAHIDLTLSGERAQTYHLAETDLDAYVGLWPAGLEVTVRHFAARLAADDLPQVRAEAALSYQDMVAPATLQVREVKLDTEHSSVRVQGAIHNFETMAMDATVSLEKIAAADLTRLVPGQALQQDLSGTLQVSGTWADLRSTLALAAADAQIHADVEARLTEEVPQYRGTLSVTRLDIQKLLGEGNIAGVVDGTVQAKGSGTALSTLTGEANLRMHALQVQNWQIGNVSLNGSLEQGKGQLTGEVSGGLGRASWQGEVHFTGEPHYELALSVERLDIKKVAAGEEAVGGELNLVVRAKGKGVSLSEMDAQTDIKVRPSTIGPVQISHGRIAARIAEKRIRIAEATLAAKDTILTLQGEIGTDPQEEGQLSYAVQVGELAPWLSLAGQKGSGALTLTGGARGNITELHVQGKLAAENLRVAGNSMQRAAINFDLRGVGQEQPHGTVTAVLHSVSAGVRLQTVEADMILQQGQPQSARLEVKVRDAATRTHTLKAQVSYQPEQIVARLNELSLALPDGSWRISQPVQIVQSKEGITVGQLQLANQGQQLLLDGRFSPTGRQDLLLQIERVSLAGLRPLFPQDPAVEGLLSAQIRVGGTAAAPDLVGTARLSDLHIAGQGYAGLSTAVAYKDNQVTLELTFQQDATHVLHATGSLPLALSWAEGWRAEVRGDLDFRTRSSGLSLAVLNAFSGTAIQGVAGELSLDLVLRGPLARPLPHGTFGLRNGRVRVLPLGVQMSAVTVEGEVNPEMIRIVEIAAKAREGNLNGSGTIALREYMPERLTVSLSAHRWPAIHTRQYQVEIAGQVHCDGPLTAPRVTGRLEVLQATLRPELAFLAGSSVKRDETIMILHAQAPSEAAGATEEAATPSLPQTDAFQNLTLDFTVALHRNTWVKHQNADVELAGEVRAAKRAGEDLTLVGAIDVVHGWVGFQGRRFTLSRGRVVFTGGAEINPTLDIVAQYRSPQYLVEALVGGTVEKPSLRLQSDPELEQADILAVLLFGKPASALGRGEKIDLQQQALAVTSGYAVSKIGESVSQVLGLEQLGIDLREVDLSGGRVGFGRYLTPKTYISASQDLAGKKGQEVSIEYQLAPDWEITTSTSSSGGNRAGIMWHKQY